MEYRRIKGVETPVSVIAVSYTHLEDDPYKVYEKIGDHATIACGITTNQLKCLSKQECLDIAKKAIDTFAPGGGFIFTTDKPLISENDVNPENLFAVYQFAHEYGKY